MGVEGNRGVIFEPQGSFVLAVSRQVYTGLCFGILESVFVCERFSKGVYIIQSEGKSPC
jgi:hypothetical protein